MGFQLSRLSFRLRTTVNGHSARVYTTVGAGEGRGGEGRERGKEVHLWERCCFVSFRSIVARTRGEKSWKDGGERKFIGQVETRLIVPSFFFFFLSSPSWSFPSLLIVARHDHFVSSFFVFLYADSLERKRRALNTRGKMAGARESALFVSWNGKEKFFARDLFEWNLFRDY